MEVTLAEDVGEWLLGTLERQSETHVPLSLGEFSTSVPLRYYPASGLLDPLASIPASEAEAYGNYELADARPRSASSWKRSETPVFFDVPYLIPSVSVDVPDSLQFEYSGWTPPELPEIRFDSYSPSKRAVEVLGGSGAAIPPAAVHTAVVPDRPGRRPEINRRRHDRKVPRWYNRALASIDSFLTPPRHFVEWNRAVTGNWGHPDAMIAALAVVKAHRVWSRFYWHRRQQWLQKHWPFPVGPELLYHLTTGHVLR